MRNDDLKNLSGVDDALARKALAARCASLGHPLTVEEFPNPCEGWRVCACGKDRDLIWFQSPSSFLRLKKTDQ